MKLRWIILFLIPFTLVAAPKKKKLPDWYAVKEWTTYYSRYYRLPLDVIYRVTENESGWKIDSLDTKYKACEQIGKAHELGPMQLKIKTARAVRQDPGLTEYRLLHDIRYNIQTGCMLLVQEQEYWRDHDTTTLKGVKDWNHMWMMTTTSYNLGRKGAIKWDKPNRYAEKAFKKKPGTVTDTLQGKLRKVKKHAKG